ncbi:MAG: helix-turn-helix domain-containing protein [Dehalococcoidia bacterium]|nr:helix-turn-helix domain-containing protein [Dehalococcoidia bacterium]
MPDPGRPPVQNWLTLGSASELLGVSESTIRRWADAGDVRSYRTRGGHRRILEEDLRQLVTAHAGAAPSRDTDRISDIAIGRIKRRISRGRQGGGSATTAFAGLDDEARDRMRRLGRQLVDLFARYVASNTKGERFTEDAHTLGREYGRTLVTSGVGLTAAVQTFNAMRRSLEETASQVAAEAGLSAEDAVEAVEATLGLADTILEAIAEVYEKALTRA